MWDDIRELAASGVTIFLTTQYLDEADELADRIAVLDHGRIVAEGTPGRAEAAHPRRARRAAVRRAATPCARRRALFDRRRAERREARPRRAERRQRRIAPTPARAARRRRIEVEQLSIHSPDLDDVFFAVTGHAADRGGRRLMSSSRLHRQRLGDDAPPQPAATPSLPVDDADARRHADRVPAAVRLRLRRSARPRARQRSRRRALRTRRLPELRHARHPADDRRRRGPGHRDRRRDGHDRRHHRPLPHDGDRAVRRADRPRPRQPDPDARQPRRRDSASPSRSGSGRPPTRSHWLAAIGLLTLFAFALDLARHRARPRRQERRDRQQHTDVPDLPALPRQRLRPDRDDAGRAAAVRRLPAVHARSPKPARAPHRNAHRHERRSPPSRGASASPSPPTCGQDICTRGNARTDRARSLSRGSGSGSAGTGTARTHRPSAARDTRRAEDRGAPGRRRPRSR